MFARMTRSYGIIILSSIGRLRKELFIEWLVVKDIIKHFEVYLHSRPVTVQMDRNAKGRAKVKLFDVHVFGRFDVRTL